MTGSRWAASCCLTVLILPVWCAAQLKSAQAESSATESFSPMVSVRELSIPAKARRAYNQGTEWLKERDWTEGIVEFQKAIEAYPKFYEAYYKIGIADLALQKSADAEAAFRKSVKLSEGRYAPPLFGLGLTLANGRHVTEAIAAVQTGLTLEPRDSAGHFTLAWVFYTCARLADAEKSAQQAVLYNPNFAMAHLLLAQIHMRQSNSVALVEDLRTFLRLDPNGSRSAGARTVLEETERELAKEDAGEVVAKQTNR
jgi:tetratricopeptide (TPR) repeat protein